ncbi:MAG TPA: hypothetical protein VD766_14120 [Solirubrobacterales bacterium]|nr:hypothetical protein [Solirubrobacterales bacterium]
MAACALAISACGEEDEPDAPIVDTAFAEALATVDAPEPIGAGVGWIDVAALGEGPDADFYLRQAGPALGPGGGDLFDEFQPKLASLGADPYGADMALSVHGSFAFGVRLDGVDPAQIARIAAKDGVQMEPEAEGWERYDLAERGVLPDSELQKAADALSSHVGIAEEAVVLARATQARLDLTVPANPGDESPSLALAAECLGDVAAARIVPNNFTYVSGIGPDLFVMGMRAPTSDGPGEEILCGVDEDKDEIAGYAEALERELDPKAMEVTSDEPVGDVFAGAEVDTLEGDGNYAARAVLTMADGAEPGAVFRGFDVGSVETFFGIQGPGSNSFVPTEK